MPVGPFRRLISRGPGVRGDVVREGHINTIYEALETMPALTDVPSLWSFKGAVATSGSLPSSASEGDAYLVGDPGEVYAWIGGSWKNLGSPLGPKGDPGNPGTAATVSVGTTTTGAAGTDATVSQTGTPQARTFNFTIPRGDKGDPGDPGTDGIDGNDGPANSLTIGTVSQGTAGATITGTAPAQTLNLTLPKGDKGDPGSQGIQGLPGPAGSTGVTIDDQFGVAQGELIQGGVAGPESLAVPGYGEELRRKGLQLAWGKAKDAHLNDRNDIDATGTSDMGATITTYLAEYQAGAVTHVYCDSGSTYQVGSTIDVPRDVYVEGPLSSAQYQSGGIADFKAAADNVTIFRLTGRGSSLRGLRINLNNKHNAVGVRPNFHLQTIEKCMFYACPSDSWGVKGGGILYFAMRENGFSGGFAGRAVDLLGAYADNPAVVYYGVNVGWFERNIFAGPQGAFRAEGIFDLLYNDFEGGSGSINPAVTVATPSATSNATIVGNYFEMSGVGQAILLETGSSATISTNRIYGPYQAPGSYGVKAAGYLYSLEMTRNHFARLETAYNVGNQTNSSGPGRLIAANTFASITNSPNASTSRGQNWTSASQQIASSYEQSPSGAHNFLGAVASGVVTINASSGPNVDLRAGNLFRLNAGTASPLSAMNAQKGQPITLWNVSGGAITLPTATWNLRTGADATMAHGEMRKFIVSDSGTIVEEVPPKQAALTAADASAVNSGDATTDTVIGNMRTRIGELESRLQAMGLLS